VTFVAPALAVGGYSVTKNIPLQGTGRDYLSTDNGARGLLVVSQ